MLHSLSAALPIIAAAAAVLAPLVAAARPILVAFVVAAVDLAYGAAVLWLVDLASKVARVQGQHTRELLELITKAVEALMNKRPPR